MIDFTPNQIAAQAAYLQRLEAHRISGHGERTRTRKALEAAAIAVLKADNEASLEVKRKHREAAYAA